MALTRREFAIGMAAAAILGPTTAVCETRRDGGLAFGSSWRISVGANADLAAIKPPIEAVIAGIDRQMSPYRPMSDLSRFNSGQSTQWQPMPKPLCRVAARSLQIADLTDGAFDPTVGPSVFRLGFGPIRGDIGHYGDVEVKGAAVRKASPGLTLDLCGIAKGYALDRICEILLDAGVHSALVELGGEVRALGQHPDGRDWQVAIANPSSGTFESYTIVALREMALATSGHSANGIVGPVAVSHIIHPPSRKPAEQTLASVSVLASDAMNADALATAFCAAGPVAGVALANRLTVPAIFLIKKDAGLEQVTTGNFDDYIVV